MDYIGPKDFQVLSDRPVLADYVEAADAASRCGDERAAMAIIEMIYARFDECPAVDLKPPRVKILKEVSRQNIEGLG